MAGGAADQKPAKAAGVVVNPRQDLSGGQLSCERDIVDKFECELHALLLELRKLLLCPARAAGGTADVASERLLGPVAPKLLD